MASIENRSRFIVTIKNRSDLKKTFAFNREKDLEVYLAAQKAAGLKPRITRANDRFAVRIREIGKRTQTLYASSDEKAIQLKDGLEEQRGRGLFIDYAEGRRHSFADLLVRYLREVSPRHKGFEVEGYILNAVLADAGVEKVDLAQVYAAHKNPHPSLAAKKFRKPSGKSVRQPSPASCFIRKPFGDLLPEDFNDYIDERCQSVAPSTVDREVDLFSAVCRKAIDTWRIPVAKSPMDGIERPKYFNERDRRLESGEEELLLNAAYEEDAQHSIESRLEALMPEAREMSQEVGTVYRKKNIIKSARALHLPEAEASYKHRPWMEAFVQFQLMTGARRSEALAVTWDDVNFVSQTAHLLETKNGRPRKLPLRQDLIALLEQLPRDDKLVFPITVDRLRKAWGRMVQVAGLVGPKELKIHDLRHEAISRVADAGGKVPGGFSLVDLQAFSGHRDTRMLLRYTHLCMPSLAKRLDEVFADQAQTVVHRGQRRLKKGAQLTMKDVSNVAVLAPIPTSVLASMPCAVEVPRYVGTNVLAFRARRTA